jgi:type I restriction enzyme M protein
MTGNFHVRFGERGGETHWLQNQKVRSAPTLRTGGFLLAAHDYIAIHNTLDLEQWNHLRHQALHGWEIVDNTARLCVMNLYLHGIGSNGDGTELGRSPIHVSDSLASHPGEYFDMVLTNPPFGKK